MVSKEVMEQIFQASKALFSLGHDDKMSITANKNNRGFTPMHEEMLDPENQTKGDTKERIRLLFLWLLEVLLLSRVV